MSIYFPEETVNFYKYCLLGEVHNRQIVGIIHRGPERLRSLTVRLNYNKSMVQEKPRLSFLGDGVLFSF